MRRRRRLPALETNIIFRHRSETSASSSSCASIREISSIGLSSSVRFKIESARFTVGSGGRSGAPFSNCDGARHGESDPPATIFSFSF